MRGFIALVYVMMSCLWVGFCLGFLIHNAKNPQCTNAKNIQYANAWKSYRKCLEKPKKSIGTSFDDFVKCHNKAIDVAYGSKK